VKNKPNIGNLLNVLVLVCGLLAITVSSTNYLIQERIHDDLSWMDYNDDEDDSGDDPKTIYLPDYVASISSFQISVDLIQNLLFNIPFFTEIKCWHEAVLEYRTISFFKILFQYIIAPNAP